ncbi:MAG: hypothetical protein IJU76_05185 [Desulfovibrionaceae bacterium]|nr:hypothetical protein [Desulfovibrionaceae bacterium]
MCKRILPLILSAFFLSLSAGLVYAEDEKDLFADYYADIRKSADAKTANVYNAWGENMSHLIESGLRSGTVVTGEGNYAGGKVRADGVGNINVDKYANVGPIINKTKVENSSVIVNNSGTARRW